MNFYTKVMFVQDIKNNPRLIYKNTNKLKQPVFQGNIQKLSKEILLNSTEIEQVSFIAKIYKKTLYYIQNLNGIYRAKFKENFPKMIHREQNRGLLFEAYSNKNQRIQIVKSNTANNIDELITFKILDKKNNELISYRINDQGKVSINSNTDNIKELSINPFNPNTQINNVTFWEQILEDFNNLSIYTDNFTSICRSLKEKLNPKTVINTINKIKLLQQSFGLKPEIDIVLNSYKQLNDYLLAGNSKNAIAYKKMYFGEEYNIKKGLLFKNLDNQNQNYSITLVNSKEDNRVFKITVTDPSDKIIENFVFFKDGKIMRQINQNFKDYRMNNLTELTDSDINNFGIKNILFKINTEITNFTTFIKNLKQTKVDKKLEKIQLKEEQKAALKAQKQQEKLRLKEEQKAALKAQKQQEKLRKEEQKAALKAKKQQEKLRLKEEQKAALKAQKQQEKPHKEEQKISRSKPQRSINKTNPTNTKEIHSTQIPKITKHRPLIEYSTTELVAKLNRLFETPVERRSPHLIHERLKDGRIFNGRVIMKSSDGTQITVSKMRYPKYIDFVYYSISVEKAGKTYTANLDGDFCKFIESDINGKIIIDKKNMIKHFSKNELCKLHPEAIDLPKYLEELFEIRKQGTPKIISSKLKINKQKILLQKKEQEVLEALSKPDEFFDF